MICLKLRKLQFGKRFLLPLTFGLYTGWLFIATVVNIAAALVKLKWDGFGIGNETWSIIILIIAVILVFIVLQKNRNAAFPLPIAWAYLEIYEFLKAPQGFKGEFGLLQITSLVGMAFLIGMAAIQLYQNRFALLPKSLIINGFANTALLSNTIILFQQNCQLEDKNKAHYVVIFDELPIK